MDSQELMRIEDQYGAHNYHPLNVIIQRGEGIWLYDTDGKKYLDCLSAYSAVNQGHCHPRLVKTMQKQCQQLTLTSRAFRNEQLPLFCKEVSEFTGFERVLPMNSGGEAVETAIKAARKWGYMVKGVPANQAEIIVAENNFHGRTTTIISFSTENQYKSGFGPLTPGFITVPYGDLKALQDAITKNTVAVFLEPIQGEGGMIIPPEGYLKGVQGICQENNSLFILDEIQTGLGRCGKLFAFEYESVKPDALVVGKALSGGFYPVSAFLANSEIMDIFKPGDHGSTFGGNPLGCAIAREALNILKDEDLINKAFELGIYFRGKLNSIHSKNIAQVRGKGLMIGVELDKKAGGARRFCEALQEQGVLCKETHEHILRFTPPLIIERKDLDWAFERISHVLETL
ncbi:MAG: ornithine--oxo-acid transaminase [candidate division KSB1 bacterium]|nr:ornithine--oxo-acid transaminase [candidate division KSB1 bacterium]